MTAKVLLLSILEHGKWRKIGVNDGIVTPGFSLPTVFEIDTSSKMIVNISFLVHTKSHITCLQIKMYLKFSSLPLLMRR